MTEEQKRHNRRWKGQDRLERILKDIAGRRNVFSELRLAGALGPNGGLLEYDFYIPALGVLVEYNGEEHYRYIPHFHKGKRDFEYRVLCDRMKEEYAREAGLILVVFTYEEPLTAVHVAARLGEAIRGAHAPGKE